MMKQSVTIMILLALLTVSGLAGTTSPSFEGMRNIVNESSLSDLSKETILGVLQQTESISTLPFVPADSITKLLKGAICLFKYGLLFDNGSLTPEDAETQADALVVEAANINQVLINNMFNPFGLAPPPRNPPAAPAAPCKVEILLNLGGRPVDSGSKFFTQPRDIVSVQAVGMPAGGTFIWSLLVPDPNVPGEFISPDAEALSDQAALATSSSNNMVDPHSTFFAKRRGSYKVHVKYTCPGGQMAEDMITMEVR